MRRYVLRATAVALLVLLLAGCTSPLIEDGPSLTLSEASEILEQQTDTQERLQLIEGGPSFTLPAADQALSQRQIDSVLYFGNALFESVRKDQINTIFSPTSAYVALAMAAIASKGETAAAFEQGMGLPVAELLPTCRALMDALPMESGMSVEAANAAYFTPARSFYQTYVDALRLGLGTQVDALDLTDPVTPINAWVNEKTKGHIPELLGKDDLRPDTAFALINAMYMDANWAQPFTSRPAWEGPFYVDEGQTVSCKYLSETYLEGEQSIGYFTGDTAEGILLPYEGGQYAFIAALPLSKDVVDIGLDDIGGWVKAAEYGKPLILEMPKFDKACTLKMETALEQMGMGIAMDPMKADLSGAAPITRTPDDNLYIYLYLQKATMCVDEVGTTASVATIVAAPPGGFASGQPYHMVFDRPYLYAVIDLNTNLPLFIGTMEDPS